MFCFVALPTRQITKNMANWGKRERNGRDASNEDHMDQQNQLMAENLSNKVAQLKSLTFDLENEANDQNRFTLPSVDNEFDSGVGLLSGSMKRMSNMVSSGSNNRKVMCYIILGLVLVFFIFYFIVSRIRTG